MNHVQYLDKEHTKNMEKRDYKKLLDAGNAAQLEKLQQNGHKKGFGNIDLNYAMKRIDNESHELFCEIAMMDKDYKAIRHEAADIANFAHMIILKCDQILKEQ